MNKIKVDILGISQSEFNNGAYALILKESIGLRRVPIIIGGFEAQAIMLEIEGIKPPRPLTHDLIKTIIETLSSNVVEVCVNKLEDETFYANLKLLNQSEIDCRASDAISIAIRFGANIYVSESVIDQAGFLGKDEEEELEYQTDIEETEEKVFKQPKSLNLIEQLEQAIKNEDYEKAAQLRDELNKSK